MELDYLSPFYFGMWILGFAVLLLHYAYLEPASISITAEDLTLRFKWRRKTLCLAFADIDRIETAYTLPQSGTNSKTAPDESEKTRIPIGHDWIRFHGIVDGKKTFIGVPRELSARGDDLVAELTAKGVRHDDHDHSRSNE